MSEVVLHVYDVTNSTNGRANSAILNLNKIMRGGMGVGGIFHGAVQVYSLEYSFGFCETGSGVFHCQPKGNPMYTYRESVSLGKTELSEIRVRALVLELRSEWQGSSYDLLSHNCNHFCDALCARLGVQRLPLWVNRFANAGDAAVEAAENTMDRLRQVKVNMLSVSRSAMRLMFGPAPSPSSASSGTTSLGSPGNSNRCFSFMGNPSRFLSRGSISSSQGGNSGHHSRQSSDASEKPLICLPWKEHALEPPPIAVQSPQRPLDSPSH